MGASYEFGVVDVATTGTVGAPGQRVFYLQFRAEEAVVSLRAEKQQVQALAQYLGQLLADLPSPGALPGSEELALVEPVEAAWTAGSIGLVFDEGIDRVVLVIEELVPTDAEGEPDPAAAADAGRLAVRLTREQAAALAIRGVQLVQSGRPPCPICGRPMDPGGHACPRTNGHGVH